MKTKLMIAMVASLAFAGSAWAAASETDMPRDLVLTSQNSLSGDILARRGADDPAGDDRGGGSGKGKGRGGADDPAGHTSIESLDRNLLARNGADDPAGDDRGGGKGKGRGGKDDPAGHA